MTLTLSRASFARKRKRTNNRAQCIQYLRTYHIAQWSSRLDWSKFVNRDKYRNDNKMLFSSCFCQKNTHKTHEIVKVAVINDNNNFAPSLFRSLCEFVGDCFGPRYFSSGAALPQKNTSVQNNHLRFHTMTSKKMVRSYYCLNKLKQLAMLLFICVLEFQESKLKDLVEWRHQQCSLIHNLQIVRWLHSLGIHLQMRLANTRSASVLLIQTGMIFCLF